MMDIVWAQAKGIFWGIFGMNTVHCGGQEWEGEKNIG